jgi:hypothetical protein
MRRDERRAAGGGAVRSSSSRGRVRSVRGAPCGPNPVFGFGFGAGRPRSGRGERDGPPRPPITGRRPRRHRRGRSPAAAVAIIVSARRPPARAVAIIVSAAAALLRPRSLPSHAAAAPTAIVVRPRAAPITRATPRLPGCSGRGRPDCDPDRGGRPDDGGRVVAADAPVPRARRRRRGATAFRRRRHLLGVDGPWRSVTVRPPNARRHANPTPIERDEAPRPAGSAISANSASGGAPY